MALEPTLSWVVALAVVTVVVSCCVLYAIRQVFSLTERVNRFAGQTTTLEAMQAEIKALSDLSKAQAKSLEAEKSRREREDLERGGRSDAAASNEQLVRRMAELEKGLLDHEVKAEDAVARAIAAEQKASLGGGGAFRAAVLGPNGELLGGRSAMDLSVADFAALMQATKSNPILFGGGATMGSSLTGSGSYGNAYAPSPQFRGLLDRGSLHDRTRGSNIIVSPSGGVFAHPPSASSASSAAVAKSNYLRGNTSNPSATASSSLALPPAFWAYERGGGTSGADVGASAGNSAVGGAASAALRRRLHSITFIAGESATDPASLVFKFAASEVVSAAGAIGASAASSSSSPFVLEMMSSGSSSMAMKGIPADGAGPGILAIPIPSVTLIEITLAGLAEADLFASITGGSPVVSIRVEHRGVLGEWSAAKQSTRDREVADRESATFSDFSPNRPSGPLSSAASPSPSRGDGQLGRPWTRQRALERASNVASCSARGSASTAVTFFVPCSPSTVAALRTYLEYLQRMLRHICMIDESVMSVVMSALSSSSSSSSSSTGGISHGEFASL